MLRFLTLCLAALTSFSARAQIEPPETPFAEYLVAPVHVHLLVTFFSARSSLNAALASALVAYW